MKKVKSSSRKPRGITQTTELILLIIAVISFVSIAYYGMAKTTIAQATSAKHTVSVVRAEAWDIGSSIAVTLYVQNVGSNPVEIVAGGINYGEGDYCQYEYTIPVRVNPGETKVLSFVVGSDCVECVGNCYVSRIGEGQSVFAYIKYTPLNGDVENKVGVAVKVLSP